MVLWSLVESPNQVRFRRPRPKQTLLDLIIWFYQLRTGADPGKVKWVNFHPPFSELPSFFFFSYPSNIEIMFDDVNKIDGPNTTPTVRAICTFAFYFSAFQPFLSLLSCL